MSATWWEAGRMLNHGWVVRVVETCSSICPRMTSGMFLSLSDMRTWPLEGPLAKTKVIWSPGHRGLIQRWLHIPLPIAVSLWAFAVKNWEKRARGITESESYYWRFLNGTVPDIFLRRTRIYSRSHIPQRLVSQFLLRFREMLINNFK